MEQRHHSLITVFWGFLLGAGAIFAQDVQLELLMPETLVGPGSPFGLDLTIANNGQEMKEAQVFVLLTLGTGSFWFYPTWVQYPPDIDWDEADIQESFVEIREILPEISWPSGVGSLDGAVFMAAILHNGQMVSNLAECTFGWSEEVQPTATPGGPYYPGDLFSTDAIVGNMRYVPAGIFTQGSPENEPCRGSDEPQFNHTLTRNFIVMETEITRQMWADLMALQPSLPNDPTYTQSSPSLNHPVQGVYWSETVLFANLLSIQNGYTRCYYKDAEFTTPVDASNYENGSFHCNLSADGYRLPSEGEWEYFCRAGTKTAFSCNEANYNSGNCNFNSCTKGILPTLEHYCVFCANSQGTKGPAGGKRANPWNLKDVHGNVMEWCWDWYGDYPSPSATDYTGPTSGSFRVVRSGTSESRACFCRSAFRTNLPPTGVRTSSQGFRLLRSGSISPTPTPTPSPTPTNTAIPPGDLVFTDDIVGNLRSAPADTFIQGSPEDEPCRWGDETQFIHTLTRNLAVMETEVSRQMWADLKAVQPSMPVDPSDAMSSPTLNHPVQMNTWYEAVLFANLLSLQNGYTQCYYKDAEFTTPVDATNYTSGDVQCNFNAKGYRLPSEGEWEFFCRAGNTTTFSCSETNYTSANCHSCTSGTHPTLEQYCVYCANSPESTAFVGGKLANPWNLKDVHGNVFEWCWDWWELYPSGSAIDYQGPLWGDFKMFRGGGWYSDAESCRSANRLLTKRDNRLDLLGFRLVRSIY